MRSNISASEHYFELFRKEAESMHTKLAAKKNKAPKIPLDAHNDAIALYKNQLSGLQAKHDALQTNLNNLDKSKWSLINEVLNLETSNSQLGKNYNNLQSEHGALQTRFENLNKSKWGLINDVLGLEDANSQLGNKYDNLYSQHDTLQSEHGKLKSDLEKQLELAAKTKAQTDAYNTEMRSQLGQANSKLNKATEEVAKLTASQPTGLLGKAYTSLSGIGNTLSSPKVLGVAALAAGLGGGYYLHHLMKEEQKKEEARDTRMRDLGLVGASLAAGLVLPEVGRAIADSTPFTDSSFSEEDIRKMRGR